MEIAFIDEFYLYWTVIDKFCVAQLVEEKAINLWVASLNLAQDLLFISFVEFHKCILKAYVIHF